MPQETQKATTRVAFCLVSESERAQSNAAGRFGGVLNVEHVGQTQVVRLNIRLKPKGDF